MRCSSILLVVTALATPAAAAAQGPAVDARLAPDGMHVAFRAMDADGATHLYVRSVWDTASVVRLADGVETYDWVPDSQRLVIHMTDGRLTVLSADGAGRRDLTTESGARIAGFADTRAVMLLVPGRWPHAPDLVRVDLATGATQLVARNDGTVRDWMVDTAGVARVAVRAGEAGAVELVRVRGDTLTPMHACAPGDVCEPLGMAVDGRVWVRSSRRRAAPALVLVDPITLDEHVVRADLRDDPRAVFRSDALYARDHARLVQALGPGPFSVRAPAADGARMLVTTADGSERTLYLFDRWAGTVTPLMPLAPPVLHAGLPAPMPEPQLLQPQRLIYRVTENDPTMPAVEFRREIAQRNESGRAVWRVTDRARVPSYARVQIDTAALLADPEFEPDFGPPPEPLGLADATDVTVVDAATLRPLSRRMEGPRAQSLQFTPARVTGDDADVALTEPAWGDGAALELLVAALPLAEGYAVRIPVFDSEALELVELRVTVLGSTADAWRVAIVPTSGDGPTQEWLVDRAGPHLVRRAVFRSGVFERITERLEGGAGR